VRTLLVADPAPATVAAAIAAWQQGELHFNRIPDVDVRRDLLDYIVSEHGARLVELNMDQTPGVQMTIVFNAGVTTFDGTQFALSFASLGLTVSSSRNELLGELQGKLGGTEWKFTLHSVPAVPIAA